MMSTRIIWTWRLRLRICLVRVYSHQVRVQVKSFHTSALYHQLALEKTHALYYQIALEETLLPDGT